MVVIDEQPSIRLEKPRGGLLRNVDLSDVRTLVLTISDASSTSSVHGPFVLITLINEHDMVCLLYYTQY